MRSPSASLFLAPLLFWPAFAVQAQDVGVSSLGATGGLNIPSAYALNSGDAAASVGNYQNPQLGTYSRRRNFTLGFGLGAGVELYGRLAEYTNPPSNPAPWTVTATGPRDLSANLKWQLPTQDFGLPAVALGITDLSGGAVNFRSTYVVASEELGPLRLSLGYARGEARRGRQGQVLNGPFGGGEVRLWDTGAALLAETDGTTRHAGLRYYSPALSWLGDAKFVTSVQRSFGATDRQGRPADDTTFNLSLLLALQADDALRDRRSRALAQAAPLRPLPALTPATPDPSSAENRLLELSRVLHATGLDRVRVGTSGDHLVVEFENQRYLHNEVDALGVVLGLAAEMAPEGVRRIHAVALKSGLVMFETTADIAAVRTWLRDEGEASAMQAALNFGRLPAHDREAVRWVQAEAERENWVRLALRPQLNYAVGTEFGLFDYSFALQARTSVPLWRGAEAYADWVQPLYRSDNLGSGMPFEGLRHRSGLQSLALQQSFWLGPRLFASAGAGRYQYDGVGAEGESILFLPWGQDTLHFRGSAVRHNDDASPYTEQAAAVSYRWRMTPTTWLEGALHRYTDESRGPALVFTRWFGDVALQMFAVRGGDTTFAGLQVSLPLTPRQGMAAAPLQLTGSPRFATSLRTRLVERGEANWVAPNSVRTADLNYKPEVELMNSGRMTPDYVRAQLPRLRESFYQFARDRLP